MANRRNLTTILLGLYSNRTGGLLLLYSLSTGVLPAQYPRKRPKTGCFAVAHNLEKKSPSAESSRQGAKLAKREGEGEDRNMYDRKMPRGAPPCGSPGLSDSGGDGIMVLAGGSKDERFESQSVGRTTAVYGGV